jgi:hypothetical protein
MVLGKFLQFQTQLYKNRETPQRVNQFIPQFSWKKKLFLVPQKLIQWYEAGAKDGAKQWRTGHLSEK